MEDNINAAVQRPTLLPDFKSEALYNLTSWTGTFFNYWKSNIGSRDQWVLSWYGNVETRELKTRIPAYDLGFLLNKLPTSIIDENENEYFLTIGRSASDGWQIDYRDTDDGQLCAEDEETLVEAAANMATYLYSNNYLSEDSYTEGKAH